MTEHHFSFCALIFGCVFQFVFLFSNQFLSSLIEPTIDWVKNLREMGKVEKLSPSPTYSKSGSKRSKMIVKAVRQTDENTTGQHVSENTAMKMDETVETERETSEIDENWQTVTNQRSNKLQKTNTHAPTTTMSFFGQTIPQNPNTDGVHSYFSLGANDTRLKPIFHQDVSQKSSSMKQQRPPVEPSPYTEGRRKRANLPPFKLEFEAQHKPIEIPVLNDLVKHNDRLNVNTASYSTHPQSRHVLLVFANDSPIYEMLFESSSWPTSICELPFKVTLPSRIPTSYSILVNRVPREWHVDSVRPLIAQWYPSTVQVARIFRDGQPINRICIDFRSNEDVQKILLCSPISIDSIRYPPVAYKPLARIDRCFRCQQIGHKSVDCSHESKCYKCGENHEYNRDCGNAVKWANCDGQHMAGSPECPWRFPIAERRDSNNKRKIEKIINSRHPLISLLRLDCIRLSFKRWLFMCMQSRRNGQCPQIVHQKQSINPQSSSIHWKKKSDAFKSFSSDESPNSRRSAMQFMNSRLHYDGRLKLRSFATCVQRQSCSLMFASHWLINNKQRFIVFVIHQPLLIHHFLLRFSQSGFFTAHLKQVHHLVYIIEDYLSACDG